MIPVAQKWPLFVVEHGMLDAEEKNTLIECGYMPIEIHHMPGTRALPVVLTEYGEGSTLWAAIRVRWARFRLRRRWL